MLLDLVLLVLGAVAGFGAAFLVFRRKPIVFELDAPELPEAVRRFRVVMSTESGAEARKLYERLAPKGDGVVEFYDGDARRSVKRD